MSDTVILTENLSKLYRIGEHRGGYETLREKIMNTFSSFFRHLSRNPQSPIRNPISEYIWALKDISFEVKRGEVVGIIGPNGAGKTTLLRILSRITEPTRGWAEIRGRVGSLLEVGTGFHPELTGRENIYLNGAILGMRKAEIDRKYGEIVDFAEIGRFIDTPVKRYSSGMRVRLAFAVAAHLEPEILLVDEVLAVGDAAFQKRCLGKIGGVAKQGRTVLFVSHNMNAISQLCERVILIEHGEIIADDETSQVISDYLCMQQSEFEGATLDTWNIEHRPGRFFKEIQINGVSLPAELVVSTGDTLRLRTMGDANGKLLRHFRSGVHISTQDGTRIMSYGTAWSSLGDIHIDGKAALTCIIDELPLIPGKYVISIGCSDDSGVVDWLENVCVLTITPNKETANRLVPIYKTHGYYLTDSIWELEK